MFFPLTNGASMAEQTCRNSDFQSNIYCLTTAADIHSVGPMLLQWLYFGLIAAKLLIFWNSAKHFASIFKLTAMIWQNDADDEINL